MAMQKLINKEDSFELVRDKIAQILADETANQMQLATDAALDPTDWDLEVYTERANPWEKWLNDTTVANKVPIINVWFDSDSFDMGQGSTLKCQAAEGSFNVDCYGYATSSDDGAAGHLAGDEQAAKAAHHAVRLVRNILMSGEYRYLELRPLVSRRWVTTRTSFQPQQDTRSVQRIVAVRLVVSVKYLETAPDYTGEITDCVHVDLKRNSDGAILAQMEYGDGCVEPFEGTTVYLDNFNGTVPGNPIIDETGNFTYPGAPWENSDSDPKFGATNIQGPGNFETSQPNANLMNIRDDGRDFTFEFWLKFRPGAAPTASMTGPVRFGANGNNIYFLSTQPGGDPNAPRILDLEALPNGTGDAELRIDNITPMVQDQWYHVAISRESTNLRFFIGGILQGSKVWLGYDWGVQDNWKIEWEDAGFAWAGMDGARFIVDAALYTENYTPPTGPPGLIPPP